jgi:hypothetical protein
MIAATEGEYAIDKALTVPNHIEELPVNNDVAENNLCRLSL